MKDKFTSWEYFKEDTLITMSKPIKNNITKYYEYN